MTDIGATVLQFAPFLIITVFANMAAGHLLFRQITYGLLITVDIFLIGGGILSVVGTLLIAAGWLAPPSQATPLDNSPLPGLVFTLMGIVAFLPLLPQVRAELARRLPIDPESAVHTTALAFAVYLVGATLLQLLAGAEALADITLTAGALWLQALIFLGFGVIGVGLGIRRDRRETLERLGLGPLNRRRLTLVVVATFGLLLYDTVVTLVWRFLDPAGFKALDDILAGLFAGLLSPMGALTLGLSAGISEEILFRGALQPRFGLLLTTLLFALGHAQYSLTPALVEVFVIGFILGLIRQRENTTTTILIHALYNGLGVLLQPILWGR
jgi:membrane protease YdiL (CAAX protease family)